MNKKNQTAVIAAMAALSVLLCASGSYIYASTETSVTNHFETGIVDIELEEYEEVDGELQPFRDYTGEPGMNPVITPGMDISKIPRITNEGNDCYVRAKLTFRETQADLEDDLCGFPDGWEKHKDGYYYYDKILYTGDEIDIFKGLKVPTDFPQEEEGQKFYLDIDVDAIQSKNFVPDFEADSPWGPVEIQQCIHEDGYDISSFKKADHQKLEVEYQGKSEKLFSRPDDFFQNFPVMMPGDKYQEHADLNNDSHSDIKLYFRSEVKDDSILLDEVKLKLTSKINGQTKTIYEGPLSDSQITDNILLGVIPKEESGSLDFELIVPPELDNQYTILNSYVKWIFSTEPIVEGTGKVQTGDQGFMGLYLLFGGVLVGCAAATLYETDKKKPTI